MVKAFIVEIEPIGKPRMTRADKWKKRDCVLRYRDFADELRRALNRTTKFETAPLRLDWKAYLSIPESWSKKKKEQHAGKPHRQKPDRDNIDKAILDSLFLDDSAIALGEMAKYWDDGIGPRIEITITWE